MYLKYLKYLLKHKWFVLLECIRVGKIWRGIWHDMSKFYPDEFIPYARYFYGTWPEWDIINKGGYPNYPYELTRQGVEKAFDLAWLKHQHRNKHHWQYWLLQEDDGDLKLVDISYKYILEMVADWKGAGRAITGKNDPEECKKWYLKNYNKINLSHWTRAQVNSMFMIK